jgi:hypothetical protein
VSAPRANRSASATSRAPRAGGGVRVVAAAATRKRVWIAAATLALGGAALVAWLAWPRANELMSAPPEPPPVAHAVAAPGEAPESEARAKRRAQARRIPESAPAPAEAPPGEPPARDDPTVGFGPPGERTGMALFPPMGTKPIKIGIVVPDDFEVPEGYVKHFQATEDGELLPAILLFHPDYEWVDETGAAIALPADRVVPPELAPPDLPIRMLEVPAAKGDAR